MVDAYLRQSPLAHLGLGARAVADEGVADAGVRLGERPFRGQIALRGDAGKKAFRDAVAGVLGQALPREPNTSAMPLPATGVSGQAPPREPNTVAGGDDLAAGPRILWLGPDEWLVVTAPEEAARTLADLAAALAGRRAAVTDVSESRAVLGLAGPNAREVLMKGCGLDLHPRVFGPGRCAQTAFARCHLLLHQIADEPAYELYVHRSFAEYLWAWLEDAAAEYGLKVVAE